MGHLSPFINFLKDPCCIPFTSTKPLCLSHRTSRCQHDDLLYSRLLWRTWFSISWQLARKQTLANVTYLSPKSCKCCPISLMTSSSDWERRFFFFTEFASEDTVLLDAAGAGIPSLLLTEFPLFVVDSPLTLVWASPAEDDSPFCALLFRQDSSESWPCPAPLACMLLMLMWATLCGFNRMTGATGELGKVKIPTTVDRAADPIAAPSSPAPSTTEARYFFRGGGDAPPVSESEEAEARVNSPRALVTEWCQVGAGKGVRDETITRFVAELLLLLLLFRQLQTHYGYWDAVTSPEIPTLPCVRVVYRWCPWSSYWTLFVSQVNIPFLNVYVFVLYFNWLIIYREKNNLFTIKG